MKKVRYISSKGSSALIEWKEGEFLYRSRVPESELVREEKEVFCLHPEWGIPWGEYWEDYLVGEKSDSIANGLRMAGIWFPEDLLARRREASSVFRQYGSDGMESLAQAIKSKLGRRKSK